MAENNIDITVVVNGVPTEIRVNRNQKAAQLIREALRESGQADQDPASWELKTKAGVVISPDQRIKDAGVVDGATLFLSLVAGGGG